MTAGNLHDAMGDDDFVTAFERYAIAAGDFHHADHVRLAWVYLRRHSLIEAIERFTSSLKRFATYHGAAQRYHETITWAYLLLIHERMQRGAAEDWQSFRIANDDLLRWKPSVLERYYTPETLASEMARRTFVLPDAARADG